MKTIYVTPAVTIIELDLEDVILEASPISGANITGWEEKDVLDL